MTRTQKTHSLSLIVLLTPSFRLLTREKTFSSTVKYAIHPQFFGCKKSQKSTRALPVAIRMLRHLALI